jgi:hypothetical protein
MRSIAYQRSSFALLLIATLLASALVGPAPRTAQAADGWSAAEQLTNDDIALFPDIVIDSQNVTHIVYTQTPDFDTSRIVRYINNRGGSWSAPLTLSGDGLFADLGRLSTVTLNGQVNLAVVYKAKTGNNLSSRIYYRLSTNGGATWGAQEQISNVASYEPAVLLDDTGQPHVVFTHQTSGSAPLDLAYITKSGGSWSSPVLLNSGTTKFNRDTSIRYTRSGGTLTLHVAYMGGESGDEDDKHIFTTRKVGAGGWEAPRQRQSNSGAGFPELVTDFQSKVYGVWQVSSSAYFYEPYFGRSLDNGTNWTTAQAVGSLTGDLGQNPAIARTASGKIAVLWEDEFRTSDKKRDVFARVSEDDGANWSEVQNISPSPGYSRNIAADANAAGFQAAWHDERKGSYQIYLSSYAVAGGSVGPSATPVLDGGLPTTRNSVVSVSFNNVTGSPDGVRYHWDAAPTDADPWVTFASPLTVQGPTGVTADACQSHTLYTQVRKGTTNGSVAQDAEQFDIGIQANVNILNRHLAGLPASYGLNAQDVFTGAGGNGASDGDPNYTRERSFYLGIAGYADCSGLSTFIVPGGGGTDPVPIVNNSYSNTPALPGGSAIGPRTITVELKDNLGNADTYDKTLIYDPANTDPTGTQTNTLGLPVLGTGGSVTANSANSIVRSLSFQGISVTDNLYGQQPNLPQLAAGKQFWGVWIANTTSPTATADAANLNWYPVRVPTPDSNFSVQWNLFTGLNITSNLRNHPGDYYVFVRFLDGAGNASTGSLTKLKVTLTAGYDIPTVRLAVQNR